MKNDFWGIRNIEEVTYLTNTNRFYRGDIVNMPTNNSSMIYKSF